MSSPTRAPSDMSSALQETAMARRSLPRLPLASLVALAASLLLATSAHAQGPALSFHIAPGEDGAVEGLADDCGRSFADPLNQSGRLVMRASSEVAEVVSECTSELGSASFSRDCELAMATSTVDFIVLVEADEEGDEWYFRTSVLSPLRAATVWSDDVFVSGTRRRATGDGCEELGNRFLGHLNIETERPTRRIETDEPEEPTHSVLEVLDTTPTLVEVWVDGTNTGMSGGQLIVPSGEADIELRATGYQSYRQPVTLTPGQVLTLRGIALNVLPAQLAIASNVVGATVLVDGEALGTTPIGGELEVEVPAGARTLRVERDGYEAFETSLSGLAPGQRRQIDVELSAAFASEEVEPEGTAPDEAMPEVGGGLGIAGEPVTPTAAEDPRDTEVRRLEGRLSRGDETLNSGEFRDMYNYDAQAGEAVEIVMRSPEFDSYLMVRGPNDFSIDNDDGTGVGANSRMVIQFPETGEYSISATSKTPGERGSYSVEILPAEPGEIEVFGYLPLSGGGTLGTGDGTLRSGEYFDTVAFYCTSATSSASAEGACATGSTVEAALASRDFDAYLYVRGPNDFALDNNDLRGTDSGLSFRVPGPGIYRMYFTSNRAGETGEYAVEVNLSSRSKWD